MEQTQNSLARPAPNTENGWPKIMGILANTLAESYQEIAGRAFAGSLSLRCPTGLSFSLATARCFGSAESSRDRTYKE